MYIDNSTGKQLPTIGPKDKWPETDLSSTNGFLYGYRAIIKT